MDRKLLQDVSKKRLVFFIGMMILGAILILVYSGLTGNGNQKFTDIVVEFTAIDGSNKSPERTMFYLFSFFGAIIYGLYFLIGRLGNKIDVNKEIKAHSFVITALLVSMLSSLILYKQVNWIVAAAIVLALIAFIKNKELMVLAVSFMFIVVYSICGLYRTSVFLGAKQSLDERYIAVLSLLLSVIFLVISKEKKLFIKAILIAQLMVPLSLLVYVASDYKIMESIIHVHVPKRAQLLVFAIIFVFIAEVVYRIKKSWNNGDSLGDVLTLGTCVSILSFNRFSGTGSIVPTDLHHPFENIIGYSQIFELGQKPFSEYIPVSGMYPILQGWFFKFFGHGYASFYYLTQNLFYLAVLTVVVFLLKKQLKAGWILLISVMFTMTDYNRVALIVPMFLLLAWPALIEKKNAWLKAWFLSSFIHGLYYPVFGAAVCFAFLPLGIWQIYSYAKSGELIRDVKTVKFWVWWMVCFIPVLCGFGWLMGTVKHMLAMGSQTIYADGMARFGQMVPSNLLSYISSMPARLIAYYVLSYLVVIALLWLSVALFFKNGNVYVENCRLKIDNPQNGFLALSIALMLLISFSYTVVRFDYYDIYARSYGAVAASFIALIVLIGRFVKTENRNVLWIFGFTIFIISMVSEEGFTKLDQDSKLEAVYTVPDGYVYVTNDKPRLGECFVEADEYEYIIRTNTYMDSLDRNQSYLGLVDSFGLFYLCDIKGDSAMEILNTIKGYSAVEETVENIRANNTIVGLNVNPLRNYYLYHWLLTSGDYVFDNNARLFFSNNGSVSREEILEQNKNVSLPLDYIAEDLGKVAGSFGSSMETLKSIFTEPDIGYDMTSEDNSIKVSFDAEFDGDEADFLYLEFDGVKDNYDYVLYDSHVAVSQKSFPAFLKKLLRKEYNSNVNVTISWLNEAGEERSQTCTMDEGKLLLPLGSVRGWLMNKHSEITITVTKDGEVIKAPELKELKVLKCREVE